MRALDRIMVVLFFAAAALPYAAMKLGARDHEIFGRLPPAPYPEQRTLAAFTSEELQKTFTAWFESKLGFKGYSIAIDNTLLYHVFHDTKPGSYVMLGDGGVLFKDEDIQYYNKSGAALPAQAHVDVIADRIADLQQRMRARRRAFVPLIIPSKTTLYRAEIPAFWTRDLGQPRPSDERVYAAFTRALDARKVVYVDARAMFMSGSERRELVWGVDGRHWTEYGACLAMRGAVHAYNELTGNPPLGLECVERSKPGPAAHEDYDLYRLLNVWGLARQPDHIPDVEHRVPPPTTARKPGFVIAGTSFCWGPLYQAEKSGLFGAMHMNYYNKLIVEWPKNVHTTLVPNTKEWRDAFADKDLYVLDLFEPFLLAPNTYVDEFLEEMRRELAD